MERREYHSAVADSARWQGFVPRAGDVFVCTPAKCGTTWMQSIVASLLWPTSDPPGPVLAISPWIELKIVPAAEMHAQLAAQTHRRFMKTHTPADGIPWFDEARYVFVARDGRDAFMSLCNHIENFRDEVRDSLNARGPRGRAATTGVGRRPPCLLRALARGRRPLLPPPRDLLGRAAASESPDGALQRPQDGPRRRDAAGRGLPRRRRPGCESWPEVVARCTFERMRDGEARIGAVDMLFKGGLKTFVFKGTNGRWRDVLTADELAAYERRVAAALPRECATWMEHGGGALER